MDDFSRKLQSYSDRANELIFNHFPQGNSQVLQAARYSLSVGGKRLRPALAMHTAYMLGCAGQSYVDILAVAMEYIHTYSLVHDDLPCMDDDDLRRGKPSCHIVYGQGMAVLAGDCLLNYAFELLTQHAQTLHHIQAAAFVAKCAGHSGMIGGQSLDISGKSTTVEDLVTLSEQKTGNLLQASIAGSAIACAADSQTVHQLQQYARLLGLCYQLRDDLLDEFGSTEKLGKRVGSDKNMHKTTFLTLLGASQCQQMLQHTTAQAYDSLACLSGSQFFKQLLEFNLTRQH